LGRGEVSGAGVNTRIMDRIKQMISPFLPADAVVTPDMAIGSDIEIDSVQVFDLVMELEDHFDISLPMNVTSEVRTIGDLARAVEAEINV